jgi:hypothetical protein
MIDWFAGAVASMSAAKDISQSLVTLRDGEMIRSKVFDLTNSLMDLQQQLMNAQVEQMALIQQVAKLQASLAAATAQSDENARYERHQFVTGQFAYKLKGEFKGEGPEFFLCSRCFENEKLVTLHRNGKVLFCPECKQAINSEPAEPRFAVRGTRGGIKRY